ncbi:MAG: DUF4190 domain-containing protein [Myxococcales bacterium]|nr:DUF4190 domain-containing protein [Myxococcales bacterium]
MRCEADSRVQAAAPRQVAPAPRTAPTSSSAVVSLAFGVLSYVALPFVGALVAIVAGHHARNEIRVSGGRMDGLALANTGLVLGYGQLVLIAVALMLAFAIAIFAIAVGA